MKTAIGLLAIVMCTFIHRAHSQILEYHDLTSGALQVQWMTPGQFLVTIKIPEKPEPGINTFTVDSFPENWIMERDIEYLVSRLGSQAPCKCYKKTISSYIPHGTATEEGYALLLLNSYIKRERINLGLYGCPTANEKLKIEVLTWWKERTKKGIL